MLRNPGNVSGRTFRCWRRTRLAWRGHDFSRASGAAEALRASALAEILSVRPSSFLARLFCLTLLFSPFILPAQDATFRMDVKLVNLFVNVTDKTGAIVGGLTKDDFQVLEDGRPQKISVFERQSELRLNLTLAIDTSGSTFKDLALEQSASKRFIHALLREQDQMSLIQFATDVRQLVPFTNKIAQLDRGLGSLRVGDATLQVGGQSDLMVFRAKCCNPIPGDEIVGYVTRGRGVAVHSNSCPNVQNLLYQVERRIDVEWARDETTPTAYPVKAL